MLEATLSSSVLILFIIAVRSLLKGRMSLRLQYALWLLAAVRLFLPFPLFESPVSVMNMAAPINVRLEEHIGSPAADKAPAVAGQTTEAGAAAPAQSEGTAVGTGTAVGSGAAPAAKADAGSILQIVWQIGAACAAAWFILKNILFYRRLRKTRVPVPVPNCRLRVYKTPLLPSPCLFGILRPAVYLTPDSFTTEEKQRFILAHELTHYRHGDHLWAFVRGAALALYWFNPLVWAAAALSRRDCELACDEGTLLCIGEENRLRYGETLIRMVSARSAPSDLLCGATTMTSGKRGIKERISMIAKKPKMLKATLALVLIISLAAAGCTFTGARQGNTDTQTAPTDASGAGGSTADIARQYENLGIAIDMPAKYDGAVTLEAPENLSGSEILKAYQTASHGTEWDGWMFSVVRHTPAEFEDYWVSSDAAGGAKHFAKDGSYIYSVEFPTDVNCSQEQYEAYAALQKEFSDYVMSRMISQNGLTAYDDSAFRGKYTYAGEHVAVTYWPYFAYNGSKNVAWTFYMSRPVRQGDTGIWCVDRWMDNSGNVYYALPKTDLTAAEYYAQIQKACDAGSGTEWLDPVQAALKFAADSLGDYAVTGSFSAGTVYTGEDSYPDTGKTDTAEGIKLMAPTWLSADTTTGVGVFLDYADDNIVVFHGYFGLFIYSLSEQKMALAVDLDATLGTTNIQGSSGAAVRVSADGKTVLLYRYDESGAPKKAFYIHTDKAMAYEYKDYVPLENAFDSFAELSETDADPGTFSDRAVKFADGYGYINCGQTIGGLTYVRGDKTYRVFDGWF